MSKELVLVLGGARSGKSAFAQRLAAGHDRVLFAATAEARDEDMARRIAHHKKSRPPSWDTLEAPLHLAEPLGAAAQDYYVVLVDCLTLWVSNLMLREPAPVDPEADAVAQTERLLDAYERGRATWVVVSNEVGLGVVPPTESGRDFRDVLGRVNQLVARRADKVYMMVAGLALELKALGASPLDLPGGDSLR